MGTGCCLCKFGLPNGTDGYVECHRFPPVVRVGDESRLSDFPQVRNYDWCAEFTPKDSQGK